MKESSKEKPLLTAKEQQEGREVAFNLLLEGVQSVKGTNQKEENIKQSSSSLKLAEIASNAPMRMLEEIEQKHLEEKSELKEKMLQKPSTPSDESHSTESGGESGMSETLKWTLELAKAKTMEEAKDCLKKAHPEITDEEAEEGAKAFFMM